MAKNSRKRIGAAGAVLLGHLAILGAFPTTAFAAGLPLRAPPASAPDRALTGLADGLDFKLTRAATAPLSAWAAMVEETVLIAKRLGWSAETVVSAQRLGNAYAVVLEGESYVAGTDPDLVLGRLLYVLAHDRHIQPTPAMLTILDQPLSLTLAALPSVSTP